MKFFLDTEFIESGPGKPIQLISIGIVAEDGREFYAISNEFDADSASDWVKKNVLPHTFIETSGPYAIHNLARIAQLVREFVGGEKPEFWGYYADYDWVVFCQMFGTMMDLPKGFPMYCRDIKQLCDEVGNPKLPEQGKSEHNALADARWNQIAYGFLAQYRDVTIVTLQQQVKELQSSFEGYRWIRERIATLKAQLDAARAFADKVKAERNESDAEAKDLQRVITAHLTREGRE